MRPWPLPQRQRPIARRQRPTPFLGPSTIKVIGLLLAPWVIRLSLGIFDDVNRLDACVDAKDDQPRRRPVILSRSRGIWVHQTY